MKPSKVSDTTRSPSWPKIGLPDPEPRLQVSRVSALS